MSTAVPSDLRPLRRPPHPTGAPQPGRRTLSDTVAEVAPRNPSLPNMTQLTRPPGARPSYRTDGSTPGLVLGTAGIGGAWGAVDADESTATILAALEWGITRVDTAPAYNRAELFVGEALRRWAGERPFVSTKVGKGFARRADEESNDYGLAAMRESLERSYERLGGRPDLVFLHEPERVREHPTGGPDAVGRVVDWLHSIAGGPRAEAIGLGGHVSPEYHDAIRAGVFAVVMSFNTLDAVCFDALRHDIPLFRECAVVTYQGSALHMGLLGNRLEQYRADPPIWVSPEALRAAAGAADIASAAGMSLPELAHRFLMSTAEVDYLVLGPRNLAQLQSTLDHLQRGPLPADVYERVTANVLNIA